MEPKTQVPALTGNQNRTLLVQETVFPRTEPPGWGSLHPPVEFISSYTSFRLWCLLVQDSCGPGLEQSPREWQLLGLCGAQSVCPGAAAAQMAHERAHSAKIHTSSTDRIKASSAPPSSTKAGISLLCSFPTLLHAFSPLCG